MLGLLRKKPFPPPIFAKRQEFLIEIGVEINDPDRIECFKARKPPKFSWLACTRGDTNPLLETSRRDPHSLMDGKGNHGSLLQNIDSHPMTANPEHPFVAGGMDLAHPLKQFLRERESCGA